MRDAYLIGTDLRLCSKKRAPASVGAQRRLKRSFMSPQPTVEKIHAALKPGGFLSIPKVIGDPDYRGRTTVRREAETAGFVLGRLYDGCVSFTVNFVKPAS